MAPDMLHQLHLGLFKHYLIPWTLELLKQMKADPAAHVSLKPVDELD